jgi:hypothetical protein
LAYDLLSLIPWITTLSVILMPIACERRGLGARALPGNAEWRMQNAETKLNPTG